MKDNDRATILAAQIAQALSRGSNGRRNGAHNGGTDWQAVTCRLTEDPHIAGALKIELSKLLVDSPTADAPAQAAGPPRGKRGWAGYWTARLHQDPHALDVLSALVLDTDNELNPDEERAQSENERRRMATKLRRGWLKRETSVAWMQVLILAPVLVVFFTVWGGPGRAPTDSELSVSILKLFSIWVLSFVPTWLYVRFLGQRAGALWSEYVLNLHRLRWDEPRYLPRPPKSSEFHAEWLDQHGYLEDQHRNLYRQKFNAYYGRTVSTAEVGTNFVVRTETMFPVFLTTIVLSASWVAVLWDPGFAQNPNSVWDILKFGFLGAYAFTLQSLIRRFFQSDLRPSAYAAVLLRLVVVFTTLLAVYQLMIRMGLDPSTQAVIAFVVGGFPLVGVYALHRTAAVALRAAVPQLTPAYPLSQIDGLNVWYEARLLEEGIEDMQNLATANLVDVILHTRVPVGRLVDWVDQAHLYLHLDRTELTRGERRRAYQPRHWWTREPVSASQSTQNKKPEENKKSTGAGLGASLGSNSRAGTEVRTQLRQLGVRTATDLLKAFPPSQVDPQDGAAPDTPRFERLMSNRVSESQIRTLVRVLDEDTGLAPIWNWQARGVGTHNPSRRPRSAATMASPGQHS